MKSQAAKSFSEFLSQFSNSKIAIAMHRKSDIDAMASAYALSSVFKKSVICTIDEPNSSAKKLAELLKIEYKQLKELANYEFEGMVVVDTSTYELLADARKWKLLCIIDHHTSEGRDMKAKCEIIDESAPSTAELIVRLIPKDKITKKVAFALACGIISDTARFKRAEKETFSILASLIEIAGTSYAELLVMAEPELEADEKIAVIKAFQRLDYVVSNGIIIATSEVGSNESAAAAAISDIIDVVFVASWRKVEKETRISARSRKHVTVELNKVMAEVCRLLGGAGGGHIHAAGATIKSPPKKALKMCVDLFLEMNSNKKEK